MRRIIAVLLLAVLVGLRAGAQQVPDPNFRFANPSPAYQVGKGPVVCVDEAHFNFHTAEGRYKSFADLLRGDGYIVQPSKPAFTAESLAACRVMVIANASSEQNREDWAYPHVSSFSRDEIVAMFNWIRGGGALLLIADHSPFAGAAADLGAMLGAAFVDGYVEVNPEGNQMPDVFSIAAGGLRAHATTKGRSERESVTQVGTFTGSAFVLSQGFESLLVLPPAATNIFVWRQSLGQTAPPSEEWPRVSVAGWSQGAARTLGKGRVVILGEAAMCSAQLAGPEKFTMGMNHPKAAQNAQFCLNTVRWLSGVLAPQEKHAQ